MRYALAAAALAAGAVAVPFNGKRAVVTDIDIVYETTYVTVTAGEEPAPVATTTTTTSVDTPKYHYGHNPWSKVWEHSTSATSTYVAAPSSDSPAPAPETPSSTYVAPEPTPTSTTAPVYVAPTSTTQAPPAYTAPASSPAPSSTAPAAPPATGYGSVDAPDDYSKKAVYHHNLHRANHSAPALAWDADLASTAAKIASSCVYAHDVTTNGGGYGQNIAAGVKPDNITAIISDLFYNGEVNYFEGLYGQAQPSMDNFEKWGHFSQIVWKGTTHVGCATQDCNAQGLANVGTTVAKYFTVCNYKSPGNYANEYADNVGQCQNKPTVDWSASA